MNRVKDKHDSLQQELLKLHQTRTLSWPYSPRYSRSARRLDRFTIGTVVTVVAAVVVVVEAMPMVAEAMATKGGTVTAGTPIGSPFPGSYGTSQPLMTQLRRLPLMKLITGTALSTRNGASILLPGATRWPTIPIAMAMAMAATVAMATVVGMAGQSEPLRPSLSMVADSSPQ